MSSDECELTFDFVLGDEAEYNPKEFIEKLRLIVLDVLSKSTSPLGRALRSTYEETRFNDASLETILNKAYWEALREVGIQVVICNQCNKRMAAAVDGKGWLCLSCGATSIDGEIWARLECR